MRVGVVKTMAEYPEPPFHPSQRYPEYPYEAGAVAPTENVVYDAVRNSLRLLGLDEANFGTPRWNPLGDLVHEGSRIVIKPNFVNHWNPLNDGDRRHFDALVTHASVIRPLLDYVHIASGGCYTVTIADLPIQSANFGAIVKRTGLDRLVDFARDRGNGRGVINLMDLRDYQLVTDHQGAVVATTRQAGDSLGYVGVDLGSDSNLVGLDEWNHLYRSLDYDASTTVNRHSRGSHSYVFSRTMLECDCLINVPKLKVHRKAGVTLSLKNLVGTIGDKACLPHYREGAPKDGGDEYPIRTVVNALRGRYSFPLRRLGSTVWRFIRPVGLALLKVNRAVHRDGAMINITGGDWYGNDTIWRMVHDLNAAMFHADKDGRLSDTVQRKYLTVIDGVIGGEAEGPLEPTPVDSGVIVAGTDPIAVDLCCTRLMGLDWRKIPIYSKYDQTQRYTFSGFVGKTADIEVVMLSAGNVLQPLLDEIAAVKTFEPAPGWRHQIELEPPGGHDRHDTPVVSSRHRYRDSHAGA